jgi:beta-xylosidase
MNEGNNFGNGGNCNNGIAPIHSTPIMMQQVSTTDYFTPIGSAFEILDRSDADGPLIEAPALVLGNDGSYILFFSSNCYSSSFYDLSYAFATSVTGPYTKSSAPLLTTGTYDGVAFISPGSCDVVKMADSIKLAFHGDIGAVDPNERGMYIMDAEIVGTTVTWS